MCVVLVEVWQSILQEFSQPLHHRTSELKRASRIVFVQNLWFEVEEEQEAMSNFKREKVRGRKKVSWFDLWIELNWRETYFLNRNSIQTCTGGFQLGHNIQSLWKLQSNCLLVVVFKVWIGDWKKLSILRKIFNSQQGDSEVEIFGDSLSSTTNLEWRSATNEDWNLVDHHKALQMLHDIFELLNDKSWELSDDEAMGLEVWDCWVQIVHQTSVWNWNVLNEWETSEKMSEKWEKSKKARKLTETASWNSAILRSELSPSFWTKVEKFLLVWSHFSRLFSLLWFAPIACWWWVKRSRKWREVRIRPELTNYELIRPVIVQLDLLMMVSFIFPLIVITKSVLPQKSHFTLDGEFCLICRRSMAHLTIPKVSWLSTLTVGGFLAVQALLTDPNSDCSLAPEQHHLTAICSCHYVCLFLKLIPSVMSHLSLLFEMERMKEEFDLMKKRQRTNKIIHNIKDQINPHLFSSWLSFYDVISLLDMSFKVTKHWVLKCRMLIIACCDWTSLSSSTKTPWIWMNDIYLSN